MMPAFTRWDRRSQIALTGNAIGRPRGIRPAVVFRRLLLLAIFGIPLSSEAAGCKAWTTDGLDHYIASISGLSVPEFSPGAFPIGGIIYEMQGTATFRNARDPSMPHTQCDAPPFNRLEGIGVPDSNYIYPTSIPNLGVRISRPGGPYWPIMEGWTPTKDVYWSLSYPIKLELIKTGNITAGGMLQGAFGRYMDYNTGTTMVEFRFATSVPVRPRVPSCSVTTPTIPVPMGRVNAGTFNGEGSVSPAESFAIQLSCSGGDDGTQTNAYVTLTDQTKPENTSTWLSLTNASTARGVKLEVLRGGVVLGYGPDSSTVGNTNQWKAGTIAQGTATFSIPLSARYVQTAQTITPGSANAVMTFTMSYQ